MLLPAEERKIIELAAVVKALQEKWQAHTSQKSVISKIFNEGKKRIFLQCGRKWGKSEILLYIIWRFAACNPKANIYYFAPYAKQAKEIIWASNRMQTFGPARWIKKQNDSELRLTFFNNAFVKLDGSDNYEAHRGTTPSLVIYDEYKDFHPMFHPAMEPNRAAKKAMLVVVGTPPDNEVHQYDADRLHPYFELADEINFSDEEGAFFQFSAYDNPHIDKNWLDKEKALYTKRGDLALFQREYMGMRVKGGSGSIFPQWKRDHFIRDHDAILNDIKKDMHKLEYHVIADPGSATVFGMLFAAVNQFTKQIYILDEIYITDQSKSTTANIVPILKAKKKELYENPKNDWLQTYDEAATWFAMEALHTYDENFQPTHKNWDKKESGLSLIKDQLSRNRVVVSSRCDKLAWEIENYVKDKNGRIPKKNDHLIDCWRYLNAAAGFNLAEEKEPIDPDLLSTKRGFTLDDDFGNLDDDDFYF